MRGAILILPLLALLSSCVDAPSSKSSRGREARQHTVRKSTQAFSPSPSFGQCLGKLGTQHALFEPLQDKYYGNGCSTLSTVQLSSVASDASTLAVTNLGPVTCSMATGFAGWARFGVDRAAEQIFGSPVERIETYGSYNCRNVAGTSRRSGHATANAIDVSAFVLTNGHRISVLDDWSGGTSDERRFLRIVHDSACKRFGMVLGPEYNSAHSNHFHLEASDGQFCR